MEAPTLEQAKEYFKVLFERHYDGLTSYLNHKYGASLSIDSCKDVAQQVFIAFFELRTKRPDFRIKADAGTFRTFLFRCGMNLAINTINGTPFADASMPDIPAIDDIQEDDERAGNIKRFKPLFMSFLHEDAVTYDELFLLSGQYMHDVKYDILAKKTGLTAGAARVRCFRLLDRLRKYMHDHGLRF